MRGRGRAANDKGGLPAPQLIPDVAVANLLALALAVRNRDGHGLLRGITRQISGRDGDRVNPGTGSAGAFGPEFDGMVPGD